MDWFCSANICISADRWGGRLQTPQTHPWSSRFARWGPGPRYRPLQNSIACSTNWLRGALTPAQWRVQCHSEYWRSSPLWIRQPRRWTEVLNKSIEIEGFTESGSSTSLIESYHHSCFGNTVKRHGQWITQAIHFQVPMHHHTDECTINYQIAYCLQYCDESLVVFYSFAEAIENFEDLVFNATNCIVWLD